MKMGDLLARLWRAFTLIELLAQLPQLLSQVVTFQ